MSSPSLRERIYGQALPFIRDIHGLPTIEEAGSKHLIYQGVPSRRTFYGPLLGGMGVAIAASVNKHNEGELNNIYSPLQALDSTGKWGKAHLVGINVVSLDVDGKLVGEPLTLREILDRLPLKPTLVVASGSPHSYHLHWCLAERVDATPLSIAKAERVMEEMVDLVPGGDPAAAKVARVWRVPGFMNVKNGAGMTEILMSDGDRYSLEQLVQAFVGEEVQGPQVIAPSTVVPTHDKRVLVLAARYLMEEAEPAVQGEGGSSTLMSVLSSVGHGFNLSRETLSGLIQDHYNDRCVPPWSVEELEHKLDGVYSSESPIHNRGWKIPLHILEESWGIEAGDQDEGSGPDQEPNNTLGTPTYPLPTEPTAPGDECPPNNNGSELGRIVGTDKTEDDVAELFSRSTSALNHRWSEDTGCWWWWDGKCWQRDAKREVHRTYNGWLRRNYLPAIRMEDCGEDGPSRTTLNWIKHVLSDRGINAVLNCLKHRARIDIKKLDNRNSWLNTPSGILDLDTLELIRHSHQAVSRITSVPYDRQASCPRWTQFIAEITVGNADLAKFLQVWAGYCLTGSTDEHLAVVLFGEGSNGKSVFTKIIRSLLGTYALSVDKAVLLETKMESHPAIYAQLEGARVALVSELPGGKFFSSDRFKALVSGDEINARQMRENFRNFIPRAKLMISTNHLPRIDDNSDGMWRRLLPVPFNGRFVDAEDANQGDIVRDHRLEDKLKAEGPGILSWMVEGLVRYHQEGLKVPACIQSEREQYRHGEDSVAEFIAACLERDETGTQQYMSTEVHELYLEWAKRVHARTLTQNNLSRQLKAHGVAPTRMAKGSVFIGWRVRGRTSLSAGARRHDDEPSLEDYEEGVAGDQVADLAHYRFIMDAVPLSMAQEEFDAATARAVEAWERPKRPLNEVESKAYGWLEEFRSRIPGDSQLGA